MPSESCFAPEADLTFAQQQSQAAVPPADEWEFGRRESAGARIAPDSNDQARKNGEKASSASKFTAKPAGQARGLCAVGGERVATAGVAGGERSRRSCR